MNRLSGVSLPEQRRFALVGDADRSNIGGACPGSCNRAGDRVFDGRPDFEGVVLDPTWLGKMLRKLTCGAPQRHAVS
jgi:hypothetical protein